MLDFILETGGSVPYMEQSLLGLTRSSWLGARPGGAEEPHQARGTLGDAGDSGGSERPTPPLMSAPLLVACPSPLCAGPPLPAPPPPEPRLIRLVSGEEPASFSPEPLEPLLAPAWLHLLPHGPRGIRNPPLPRPAGCCQARHTRNTIPSTTVKSYLTY